MRMCIKSDGTHALGILDLHVRHVGGEVQKNILSVLLWAPANVGEKHCLVCPKRLVASQELVKIITLNAFDTTVPQIIIILYAQSKYPHPAELL